MNTTPPKNEYSMTDAEKKDIAIRIGAFRQKANLSARSLSLLIEKADGYINRIETTTEHLPSMETFIMIIKACGITPEQFFYHNPKTYESDMQLLKIFENLSEENREHLIALLKNLH